MAPAICRTLVRGDRPGLVDMLLRSRARPGSERGLQPPGGPSTKERQAGLSMAGELREATFGLVLSSGRRFVRNYDAPPERTGSGLRRCRRRGRPCSRRKRGRNPFRPVSGDAFIAGRAAFQCCNVYFTEVHYCDFRFQIGLRTVRNLQRRSSLRECTGLRGTPP